MLPCGIVYGPNYKADQINPWSRIYMAR